VSACACACASADSLDAALSLQTRIDSKGLDMLKAAHRTSIIGKDDFLALEGEEELGRSLRRSIRHERRGRRSGASSPRSLGTSASSTPRGGSGSGVVPTQPPLSLLSLSAPAHRMAPLLYSPPPQREHYHLPPHQPSIEGADDSELRRQQQRDGPAGQDDAQNGSAKQDSSERQRHASETDAPLERLSPPAPTSILTPLPPLVLSPRG
jgi:hypothetical protein